MDQWNGKYTPSREAIIQGRTLKYNEQDKPGRIEEDIRQAAAWANWEWDSVMSFHVNFDADQPGSWIYWTAVLMIRIEV